MRASSLLAALLPVLVEERMQKAITDFLFGLCFGMGFYIAANVINFIGSFIHAH